MRNLARTACAALLLGAAACALAADQWYFDSIQRWRDEFDKDVRTGGWLELVARVKVAEGALSIGSAPGSDVRLSERAQAHLGRLSRGTAGFRFEPAEGAAVLMDGKPVSAATELPTKAGGGVVTSGTFTLVVRPVGDDFYLFVRDSANPVIKEFKGTAWFPIDPSFRVQANFTAYDKPEKARVSLTHVDTKQVMDSTGDVTFVFGGKERRLKSFVDEGELFVMFQDGTNGTETYGGGRFLHAPMPRGGVTLLDFNKAFNPYCSVNKYVMCLVPPPGNTLDTPLRAGEKLSQ